VVAEAVFEYAELPAVLYARTRYECVVPGVRRVLRYDVTFGPTVVNCVHGVVAVLTSSLNPDSLEDWSTQLRLI
jgi:hypothetical protein